MKTEYSNRNLLPRSSSPCQTDRLLARSHSTPQQLVLTHLQHKARQSIQRPGLESLSESSHYTIVHKIESYHKQTTKYVMTKKDCTYINKTQAAINNKQNQKHRQELLLDTWNWYLNCSVNCWQIASLVSHLNWRMHNWLPRPGLICTSQYVRKMLACVICMNVSISLRMEFLSMTIQCSNNNARRRSQLLVLKHQLLVLLPIVFP